MWLLEDLVQTTAYIDALVQKGEDKPCPTPFEYPDWCKISSCFLSQGEEKAH